jgi:hypothetical protein
MEERIALIDSYISTFDKDRQDPQRRITTRGFILSMRALVVLFGLTAILLSFINGYTSDRFLWDDWYMALVQTFGLNSLIFLGHPLFEWILLRHKHKLQQQNIEKDYRENNEVLSAWMQKNAVNRKKGYSWYFFVIYIIMVVLCIWRLTGLYHPVWPYMQIPFLLFYFWRFLTVGTGYISLQGILKAV